MKRLINLLLALLLTSCTLLQDQIPSPQNISTTQTQVVNTTAVVNQTNTTNVTVEPPSPVLLPVNDKLAVYVLDTTKKGSTIITLDGFSILVNSQGGSDGLRTLKIIKNLGILKLNTLFVTNNDEDNIQIVPILLRVKPHELIHSGIPSTSSTYKQYVSLYPNATSVPYDGVLGIGNMIIDLIVPYDDGFSITSGEESTVVLRFNYGDTGILVMTDCAIDCETRVQNQMILTDVIISNGGCDSLNFELLQSVNPELVVFSGTPCAETLERVKSLDLKYLTTTADGDVVITSDGITYEYRNLKTR